jgi:tryptophanyl-tRNA synthetase
MKKAVAGITATGSLTLGNYIGAIKPMIKMQDEYELFIFVANLHALVLPIDPKELEENTSNVLKIYKAAGLDTDKVKLFKQSDISEHNALN